MKTAKAKKAGKNGAATKFKKSPDAPKRFKSAFIIFSAEKHREIKKQMVSEGKAIKTTEIAKIVSESWKSLSPEERKVWDDRAEKDKVRYEAEKAIYKGPWKIPSNKRKTKDPSAPERPMSAFLAYSNSRRAALKRENPKSTNADLSRMLSKSWKELDPEERAEYMAEERKLREHYKTEMSKWREKCAEDKRVEREEREAAAMEAVKAGPKQQRTQPDPETLSPGSSMENKWAKDNQQQEHQQQLTSMVNGGMFPNPYLQTAAFGGPGAGQGIDAMTATLNLNPGTSGNPYLVNGFAGQGYMQGMPGMPGAGKPAFSLFGAQGYMQNGGISGFYGPNFGMAGMGSSSDGTGVPYGRQMQP